MDIELATIDVWILDGEFSPGSFLRHLGILLQENDIMAFGAYSPSARLCSALEALGATQGDAEKIYQTCFELNRRGHPNGRSFELPASADNLAALIEEAERTDGQDDKPLFFDHFVAYRRGTPVVPLMGFHDAFFGGRLRITDLHSPALVREFAAALPCPLTRERFKEWLPSPDLNAPQKGG